MLDYQKIFYKTKAKFRADLESGIIPNEAIVFVGDEDSPFIYTHGVEFKGTADKKDGVNGMATIYLKGNKSFAEQLV